jgi:hypothetical protein
VKCNFPCRWYNSDQGQTAVTKRLGKRRSKLLDDLGDRREYSHLKEEALERTRWRNHLVVAVDLSSDRLLMMKRSDRAPSRYTWSEGRRLVDYLARKHNGLVSVATTIICIRSTLIHILICLYRLTAYLGHLCAHCHNLFTEPDKLS